ncbi:hypothetical protein GQX74_009790 [Glossina fuscipes]|nr:hypothetical protein GQX74_009790 [Glossina fuscipes]
MNILCSQSGRKFAFLTIFPLDGLSNQLSFHQGPFVAKSTSSQSPLESECNEQSVFSCMLVGRVLSLCHSSKLNRRVFATFFQPITLADHDRARTNREHCPSDSSHAIEGFTEKRHKLILMTYGASIPRIAPRPTLDCLREPKVPIYIPVRSQPKSFGLQTPLSPTIPSVIFKDPVLASGFIEPEPVAVPTPLRSPAPLNAIYDEDEAAGGGGDYAAGSARRERSPSILLELAPPDPTQPRLGPGWGRPMSPMDLPPEKSSSSRSPKLLLKPKLHIPLGKLGRSVSSEPRESNRLREDLQLHVENPIFNTENLRQRNFDVFFDAGEPVYKLQPKSPLSAPTDSASGGSNSPPLSNYAGVYDPLSKKSNRTTKGGLFARSPREERALAMRSKSTDHYEDAHGGRSASLGAGGAASTVSGGGVSGEAGGSGSVPQKGDRCPQQIHNL